MNRAILIGNLGKEVEVRKTTKDFSIANLSLATTERFKEKSKTEWHKVVVLGKLAELCGSSLKKGEQVYVEGRSKKTSWEKDGITRFATEIVASKLLMLGAGTQLGINKVVLIGRLGTNPDIRYTQGGLPVAGLSIATNEKNGDEVETMWHRVIALGKLAEVCERYLKKGRQVCIEGRFQTRSWKKNGTTLTKTEIIASYLEMLGSKSDGKGSSEDHFAASASSDCEYSTDDIPF